LRKEVANVLEGPLVFVSVDTQRDFLEPSGALYVAGSNEIVPNLGRLTQFARVRQIPTVATACSHLPDDPELEQFPPHCMAETPGQAFVPQTLCPESIVLKPEERLAGALPLHLTLQKRELDVFSRPDATGLIERYNRNQPISVVYGVATDYCVRAAVQGLLQRHCRVAIVVDAIRAIDPSAEAPILTEFARRGVLLTMTEVVCRTAPV
jgi:nicotinamidase/pyrazinamidase